MDIEREDGHEVFVSFYILIAVVCHYPGSISNFISTPIQVLKRRFLAMNPKNKLRCEDDLVFMIKVVYNDVYTWGISDPRPTHPRRLNNFASVSLYPGSLITS